MNQLLQLPLKKILLITLLLQTPLLFAQQHKHELGVGLGATCYSGEIVKYIDITNLRPAVQFFYRSNFSHVFSIKLATTIGQLQAKDSKYNKPINSFRNHSFSGLVYDFTFMVEYNFLDYGYNSKHDEGRLSPYFTMGLGLFGTSTAKDNPNGLGNGIGAQISIPFGVGVKYMLTPNTTISWQFIANKTFTDQIDGIYESNQITQSITEPNNSDWYYYTGFTISRLFWNVHCPEKPLRK
jgi:hypothetical protein